MQGVNLHSEAADALLRRFAFVPFARLDDLMVSLAAPGGGVGPHVDSYDVFLLQGAGRRRWRYGRQRDLALRAGLPLKILRRFKPAHDAVLGPGDMLYLPPSYAHDGVAIDPCITYSIGFRAPATNELAVAFLDWLRDSLALDGRYADPDLRATREPARIGASMQRRCAGMLAAIRWDRAVADRFLGSWLSEPKPSVFFTSPARPAIVRRIPRHGSLAPACGSTRARSSSTMRGTSSSTATCCRGPRRASRRCCGELANARALPARAIAAASPAALRLMYDWHRHGYLHADTA